MRPVTFRILAGLMGLALAPANLFAQEFGYLEDVLDGISGLIEILVPLLLAVALVLFIWGLLGYLLKGDDDTAREESRWRMIWGIILLFVIVTVWGLVALLIELTGVEPVNNIEAPQSEF